MVQWDSFSTNGVERIPVVVIFILVEQLVDPGTTGGRMVAVSTATTFRFEVDNVRVLGRVDDNGRVFDFSTRSGPAGTRCR